MARRHVSIAALSSTAGVAADAIALVLALVLALSACGQPHTIRDAAIDAPVDAPPDVPRDAGVPDLQLVAEQMIGSVLIQDRVIFQDGSCEVIEGCVGGAGARRLLRFATVTANRGTGDLSVGLTPPAGQDSGVFEWSQCHMHHHYAGYTRYELVNATGVVVTGRKQSFCIKDTFPLRAAAPSHYSCFDQGMSRDWSDGYGVGVPCQWIDITGVPSGVYTLRVIVNPLHTLPESDYDNNVLTIDVTL